VRILPWDSDFFGFRVAELERGALSEKAWPPIHAWCREQRVRCVYYRADPVDFESSALALQSGFLLADVRLLFERSLDRGLAEELRETAIRPIRAQEWPIVEDLARSMAFVSRFHRDSHFPQGAAGEMYVIWVRKVGAGRGEILVAEVGDRVAGFIACDVEDGVGDIALVGLAPEFRGQGLGGLLVRASLRWFQREGCSTAQVVTQGHNVPAQRIYQRAGFLTKRVSLVYHRWFNQR
ncbi:MAG: GNAT family N-acetyltransferase, partial [Anaerolineae bacterium]